MKLKNQKASLISLALLIITSSLVFYACKKEGKFETGDLSFNIKNAKEWYYGTFKKSPEYSQGIAGITGKISPDWNNATYKKTGSIEIVEMPLQKERKNIHVPDYGNTTTAERKRIAAASLSRLLLMRGASGKVGVRVIEYIPEKEYLQNHNYDISHLRLGKLDADYSGIMSISNWLGKLITKKRIQNGKVTRVIKDSPVLPTSGLARTTDYELCHTTTNTTEIMWCYGYMNGDVMVITSCSDWEETGSSSTTECEVVEEDECAGMTEEQCLCQMTGFCGDGEGAGGGEGGGSPPPEITVDTSITNHEKVNCVYNKLMSTVLLYGLKQILTSFDNNQTYNVTFKVEDINSPGRTNYLGNNNFLIRIDATDAYDEEYSRIWLASTFIHEAFHAKLRQKALELIGTDTISNWPVKIDDMDLKQLSDYFYTYTNNNGSWNNIGHDWMVNNVNQMADAIKEFVEIYYQQTFSNVGNNPDAYKALALMGLKDSQFYSLVAPAIGDQNTIDNLRGLFVPNANNCSN